MAFQVMDVARYIINYCTEQVIFVSNLKLQKMLYYLWIDYYQNTNEYLFDEDICAWPFGPVVPNVYYEYCSYAGTPIAKKYDDLNNIFNNDITIEINNLINKYIDCTPNQLVNKSHESGLPWDIIYNQNKGYKEIIPFDLIVELEC